VVAAAVACSCHALPPAPAPAPPPLPQPTQIDDVVLSRAGSCGRLAHGGALCWGTWGGQLLKVAIPAAGLTDVAELRVGHDSGYEASQRYYDHLCARIGTAVHCWGNGQHRQLGPDAGTSAASPIAVTGLPPAAQLALGEHHTCARSEAGDVWCWGDNQSGQTGTGGGQPTIVSPTKVAGLGPIAQIETANLGTCALTTAHEVYCWGENLSGAAGAPNLERPVVWTPNRVAIASGSRQIAGGDATLCALKLDGTIACWGALEAQLAASLSGVVPDIADATAIAVGYAHACALRIDHSVWCWGRNDFGELGGGDPSDRTAPPRQVRLPGPAIAVVAASRNTCARLEDRRWYCWGENLSGQIAPRTASRVPTPALLDLTQVDLVSQ